MIFMTHDDFIVRTGPVNTITVDIPVPDAITQLTVKDIPSTKVEFVSENLSAKDIRKVLRHEFNCRVRVYYSRTRARFLVIVKMPFGLLRISDVESMFAETDAVILPVKKLLSKDEAVVETELCERFRALSSRDVEEEIGHIIYLRESELRHAS